MNGFGQGYVGWAVGPWRYVTSHILQTAVFLAVGYIAGCNHIGLGKLKHSIPAYSPTRVESSEQATLQEINDLKKELQNLRQKTTIDNTLD